MAVSLIRRIFTISLLYKTAQEGTSKKMQGHPLHVLDMSTGSLADEEKGADTLLKVSEAIQQKMRRLKQL